MRPLAIGASLAALGIAAGATAIFAYYRSSLSASYATLREGQARGATLVAVDRERFDEWNAAIALSNWETIRTTDDAFFASFPALPDAGFSPNIDGYLALMSTDLPEPDELSLAELQRWRKAAGIRQVLGMTTAGEVCVHESEGVIRGFRLPATSQEETLHLGMLENGKYVEYVTSPSPSVKADSELPHALEPTAGPVSSGTPTPPAQ